MNFVNDAHKFTVSRGNVQLLEFGRTWFFTTLIHSPDVNVLDQAASSRTGLYGRDDLLSALYFKAECVVLMPKRPAPEIQLRNEYDFGFVQGMCNSNIRLEYWGKSPSHGRTIMYHTMPNDFEVDTDLVMKPFTRPAATRFNVQSVTHPGGGQLDALKITAGFEDHPLYSFRHTLPHELLGVLQFERYIRWVFFRREFRTIFCFRDKRTGAFTPISSTGYFIDYNHRVSYSNGGTDKSVTAAGAPVFPVGGSPSYVNATDRRIMQMAQAGRPLCTQADLKARLLDKTFRSETEEDNNRDWEASFWR